MRSHRPKLASPAVARLATVGLGAVLVFLGGFGFWTARHSARAAEDVQLSRSAGSAYMALQGAIDLQRLLEDEYGRELSSSPDLDAIEAGLDRAFARVRIAAARVSERGDAADRTLAARLIAEQDRYHVDVDTLLAEIRRGGASSFRSTEARPAVERVVAAQQKMLALQREVIERTERHRGQTTRDLAGLETRLERAVMLTLGALVVGLLLFVLFAVLLKAYRSRVHEADRQELERLSEAALTDPLTGIRNHRAFQEDLARELRRRTRDGSALSLVLLDLDGLKPINDRLGHQRGDELLKALAGCLAESVRGSDTAYRVGGDEFALILSSEDIPGALSAVERLQATLADVPHEPRPRVSAGIAGTIEPVGRDELVRRADVALYDAKHSHRQVAVYAGETAEEDQRQLRDGDRHLQTLARSLALAVDAKDSATRSHCETVAEVAMLVAAELGLEPQRAARIRRAGLLHDVGKIGVADSILSKPSALTGDEFEVMKSHSALGHGILMAAGLREEARWVLHHHERVDGRGYPAGLRGDEVPLESRILLVVDAYEAMTGDRPYRLGCDEAVALAELDRHAGTQFDPECVAALRRVLKAKPAAADHETEEPASANAA
ncbi:MAG: diguanylate cyclase [Thermoleophilaceae bacterium]